MPRVERWLNMVSLGKRRIAAIGVFTPEQKRKELAREDAVHAIGKIFQTLRRVSSALLGDAPAVVADLVQRSHDRGPVVVAFEELNAETGARPFLVALLAAVFFDVELLDALAEDANPLFWPAVIDDVADVEVPANELAVELVNVSGGLER